MPNEKIRRFDFSFFLIVSVIFAIGVLNLYSAVHSSSNLAFKNLYKVQSFWFFFSCIVGLIVSQINPKEYFRFAYLIYFINLALIIIVFIAGDKALGARRWLSLGFFKLQPSEPMKVSLVLALSRWFSNHKPDSSLKLSDTLIPFFITAVPAVLTILQPDLGTGLVMFLILAMMVFFRKIEWKAIFIIFILAVMSGAVVYKYGLKDYQRRRISTFLNPRKDIRGHGYNAIQSRISIGSGKLLGKGFKNSSQARLNYLPENHTDFAFSIFNEEHGFVGSLFLISLFLVFFWKLTSLAQGVFRIFDSLLTIGLMSIIYWHTFINMAMVTGMLPIVGLPLTLISYGGSNLMIVGICIGIITSISNRKTFF